MDWVKLFVESYVQLIDCMAWPLTVLIVLLIFRKPLFRLLQRIKKVGAADLYAEFTPPETQKVLSEKIGHRIRGTERPVTNVWEKEVLKHLIMTGLTRQERLIAVLRYDEKLTFKEIGASLDLSESSVRRIHSSMIARLKTKMESIPEEWTAREAPDKES